MHSNATMPKSPPGHRCPGEEKNELGLHKGFTRLLSVAEPVTDLTAKAAVFTVYTLVLMGKNA